MAEMERRKLEEKAREEEEARKAEEARIAAEKEFLEKHERERRLSSHQRRLSTGNLSGYTSPASSHAESESDVEKRKRVRSSPEDKEKKKKTKKTDDVESGDDEDEAEDQNDSVVVLTGILYKMKAWFKQSQIIKMVTKPQTEKFGRYLDRFQNELIRVREREKIKAEVQAEERAVFIKTVKEELNKREIGVEEPRKGGLSFAEAAARRVPTVPKVTGVKGPVLPAPKVVLVRHENKESEEVKATLKRLVKPSEIGLKVRRLINIRNGVMVEAETEKGVENLIKQKVLMDAGLTVEKPTKKKPVIMIYDVNASLSDGEIREEVFMRNMRGSEVEQDVFEQEFDVKHKIRTSNQMVGRIISWWSAQ